MNLNSLGYKYLVNQVARQDGTASSISIEDSSRLKETLFEMAIDLDHRCRRREIHLFLVGGTLLGAVRHGGFIPWDDDLDLGLMRDDYERLKEVFQEDFSDAYELRCPNSPSPNGNRFMQIFKRGTILRTPAGGNPLQPQSVYIDVFPHDFAPQNPVLRWAKGAWANALMFVASCVMDATYGDRERLAYLRERGGMRGKALMDLRAFTGKAFSFRGPTGWFDSVDRCIRGKRSGYITSATGRRHYLGETYPADVFLPLEEMDFEGHSFFVPGGWSRYLVGNYGENYMVVPPKDSRESHFITELILEGGDSE